MKLENLFKLLIFGVLFFILTRFNLDPDFGWHIAYGREFLNSGKIIYADQFSWTMPGFVWGNTYFLYQVLVAYILGNLNYLTAIFLFGAFSAIAVLFVLPKKVNLITLLISGLGAAIAIANIGVKPHTFSFLFFAVLLFLLDKRHYKQKHGLFLFPLIFLLWGNIHRGFVLGLAVFAVFVIIEYFQFYFRSRKKIFMVPIIVFFVSFVATFFNFYGLEAWQSGILGDATSINNLRFIQEWQPLVLVFPINLIYLLSALIFIYILRFKSAKAEFAWLFLASLIFAFTFVSAVFAMFWAVIFIFVATRYLGFEANLNIKKIEQFPLYFSTVSVILVLFLNFLLQILEYGNLRRLMEKDGYPVGAVDYLDKQGVLENLYNDYAWGGFIDWQLPQQKVFIDGRMASWERSGVSILADHLAIRTGDCSLINKYQIKSAFIAAEEELLCFDSWRVVYEDDVSRVLVE